MTRAVGAALLCGAIFVSLAACGAARVVKRTQVGGELALEGERAKAMEHAHQLMSGHCQGPYTIVEEGEVVIGSNTAHADESYVTEDGTVVNQGGSQTRDAVEWRVKYVCGHAAPPEPDEAPEPYYEAPEPYYEAPEPYYEAPEPYYEAPEPYYEAPEPYQDDY